jgi:fumarate hydratase, class II
MKSRYEKDSFGTIDVEQNMLWGAQTQRSLSNFPIGVQKVPMELIYAYAYIKKTSAMVNYTLKKLFFEKKELIVAVCDEIIERKLDQHFPLHVWQTGSGTHTNMNLNEVICNRAKQINSTIDIHPNDDVNMGQSSNDTFPTAMKIASCLEVSTKLLPTLLKLKESLQNKETEFKGIIKVGRTHLQDATPLYLSDEIRGYSGMIEHAIVHITEALQTLKELPIGGTAVGTGINSDKNFGRYVVAELNKELEFDFKESKNKFHGLTSHDSEVFLSGALNGLASDLLKIVNDIRMLSSGPMCGIGELSIPANEAGSSIMPGKVNPTQIEALSMICVQVLGNHTAISFAASQGNFELNVYKPLIIYNLLQSITLLNDGINSFTIRCLDGLRANKNTIESYLEKNLMLVTALNPFIGYDKAAQIAKHALKHNLTLRQATIELKILSAEKFDEIMNIEKMI